MTSTLLLNANALNIPLADQSVHCVVTSPPYFSLRDYGIDGQLGLENSPEEYVTNMVAVFREVKRVLRDDGVLWLNIGDSYAGSGGAGGDYNEGGLREGQPRYDGTGRKSYRRDGAEVVPGRTAGYANLKPKDLVGIPWMLAFALRADGWWLRSDCIWHKPNPMPESVTDRPTKSHEYVFLLSKSARYFYDNDAIREPTVPDPRDAMWGKTETTSRHDHKHDLEMGMSQIRTQSDGFVRMSNPAGRNRRTVWTIATAPYSGAHFATYPPDLVEPCIKAGTSEHGVCPECGAPWERVVEYTNAVIELSQRAIDKRAMGLKTALHGKQVSPPKNITTGWQPTCSCYSNNDWMSELKPIIPAVVFDPFAGSGTTLMVARSLGRNGVGLDLSYAYLHDQARHRLELDRLDAWGEGIQADDNDYHGLPLFNEAIPPSGDSAPG
jgi:DNA modification methylase